MEKDKRDPEKSRRLKRSTPWWPVLRSRLGDPDVQISLLVIATSFIVALLLTPSFINFIPSYNLGDVVDRNIKAERDFLVLDKKATERKRKEAAKAAPLVFDFDQEAEKRVQQRLIEAFQVMQRYLHAALPSPAGILPPDRSVELRTFPPTPRDIENLVLRTAYRHKEVFEETIGFKVPNSIFQTLAKERFSQRIVDRVKRWISTVMVEGITPNRYQPRLMTEKADHIVIRRIPSKQEMLVSTFQYYRNMDDAKAFIAGKRNTEDADAKILRACGFLASQLLEPNIVFNRVETGSRRAAAAQAVKPVYIQVKKNEMLVREGQRVGPEELLKLHAYRKSSPEHHRVLTFAAIFLFCALFCFVILKVSKHHLPFLKMAPRDILFLSILLIFLLSLCRSSAWMIQSLGDSSPIFDSRSLIFAIPMAAGSMLTAIFFGITASLTFSLTVSLFTGILFGNNFDLFIFFLVGSLVGAHSVVPCRNRMIPIRAGLLVGAVNVLMLLVMALLRELWAPTAFMFKALFGFFGGVFSGILVTGFTPLAEIIFGYTTDIRLLELASMDQPLLQQLLMQAPGTYHHSIIVGNMVETAAKSIGANSLLAKVAAYYHDIGKIKKPLYFIENQMGCENRHEKLAPSMSGLILISHVKEGVELARRHRLGKPISDIISQHHGTSLITFFYQKALEARKKAQDNKKAELPPINMEDYRYPGPKPQTKEAGLVMLADVVEAACRSLSNPTAARIQGMVSRLINNVFSDGQLDECELTLKDLHRIAKHFNQILATVHHKRIEYPSQSEANQKGKSHGRDLPQHETATDRHAEQGDGESSRSDLKRLGLH